MMAGVAGFEPAHGDTKNRCLTTWLHPNCWRKYKAMPFRSSPLFTLGCVNYADIIRLQTAEIEFAVLLDDACHHVNPATGILQRSNGLAVGRQFNRPAVLLNRGNAQIENAPGDFAGKRARNKRIDLLSARKLVLSI